MAYQLRVLVLAEDLYLTSSTHMVAHDQIRGSNGYLWIPGIHTAGVCIYIYIYMQNTYTHKYIGILKTHVHKNKS